MAEVTNKKMLDEDEFFHVCELQYFVTRLNWIDVAINRFVSYSINLNHFQGVLVRLLMRFS
jgi:hypothetical protein